nr:urokinase plasminogen activator surface receptor [Nothobranchius furzeri]
MEAASYQSSQEERSGRFQKNRTFLVSPLLSEEPDSCKVLEVPSNSETLWDQLHGTLCSHFSTETETERGLADSSLVSNGRQCFTCKGTDCTGSLNCEGSEDHCIKATRTAEGVTKILKGCTSKQFCSGDAIAQAAHMTGVDVSCCQGNFCNSASGPIGGLLLLMVPLISFILFS